MTQNGPLQIESRVDGLMTIVTPQGDIDLYGSPTLRAELKRVQAESKGGVIVDLVKVPYMDSSGCATLVEAAQTSRKTKTKLVLCNLTDRVKNILHIARLDSFFVIAANLEAAKNA